MLETKSFDEWSATAPAADPQAKIKGYADYLRTSYFKAGQLNDDVEGQILQGVQARAQADGLITDEDDDETKNQKLLDLSSPLAPADADAQFLLDHYSYDYGLDSDEYLNKAATLRKYFAMKKVNPSALPEVEGLVGDLLADKEAVKRARVAAVDRGDVQLVAVDEPDGRQIYTGAETKSETVKGQIDSLLSRGAIASTDLGRVNELIAPINGGAATAAENSRFSIFANTLDELAKADPKLGKAISDSAQSLRRAQEVRLMGAGEKAFEGFKQVALGTPAEVLETAFNVVTGKAFQPAAPIEADPVSSLVGNEALLKRGYTENEIRRFTTDYLKRAGGPAYRADKPESGIDLDSLGNPIIAPQLLPNKAMFDKALLAAPLNEEQKQAAQFSRQAQLESSAPTLARLIVENDSDGAAAFAQAKAAGRSDAQFVEDWVSKNGENYSGLFERTQQFGSTIANVIASIPFGIAALAGSKNAVGVMADFQKDQNDRQEYSRLMGDEYGLGFQILNTVPQVATDILATIGTSGGYIGLKSALKGGTRGMMRAALRNAATRVAPEVAVGLREVAEAGKVSSMGRVLRDLGEDWAVKLNKVELFAPQFATTFTRSASSSYVSIYNQLPETMSHEEKHRNAIGYAIGSGLSTAVITTGLSFLGRGAVEDVATNRFRALLTGADEAAAGTKAIPLDKLTFRQAKILNSELKGIAGQVSDASLKKELASNISNAYKTYFRNVFDGAINEGFEETLDQAINAKIEAAATNQDIPISELANQLWNSFVIGGALGGASPAVAQLASKPQLSDTTIGLQATADTLKRTAEKLRQSGSVMTAEVIERQYNDAWTKLNDSRASDLQRQQQREEKEPVTAAADPNTKTMASATDKRLDDLVNERVTYLGSTGYVEYDPKDPNKVILKLDKPLYGGETFINLGTATDLASSNISIDVPTLSFLEEDTNGLPAGAPTVVRESRRLVLPTKEQVQATPDLVEPVYGEDGALNYIRVKGARYIDDPTGSTLDVQIRFTQQDTKKPKGKQKAKEPKLASTKYQVKKLVQHYGIDVPEANIVEEVPEIAPTYGELNGKAVKFGKLSGRILIEDDDAYIVYDKPIVQGANTIERVRLGNRFEAARVVSTTPKLLATKEKVGDIPAGTPKVVVGGVDYALPYVPIGGAELQVEFKLSRDEEGRVIGVTIPYLTAVNNPASRITDWVEGSEDIIRDLAAHYGFDVSPVEPMPEADEVDQFIERVEAYYAGEQGLDVTLSEAIQEVEGREMTLQEQYDFLYDGIEQKIAELEAGLKQKPEAVGGTLAQRAAVASRKEANDRRAAFYKKQAKLNARLSAKALAQYKKLANKIKGINQEIEALTASNLSEQEKAIELDRLNGELDNTRQNLVGLSEGQVKLFEEVTSEREALMASDETFQTQERIRQLKAELERLETYWTDENPALTEEVNRTANNDDNNLDENDTVLESKIIALKDSMDPKVSFAYGALQSMSVRRIAYNTGIFVDSIESAIEAAKQQIADVMSHIAEIGSASEYSNALLAQASKIISRGEQVVATLNIRLADSIAAVETAMAESVANDFNMGETLLIGTSMNPREGEFARVRLALEDAEGQQYSKFIGFTADGFKIGDNENGFLGDPTEQDMEQMRDVFGPQGQMVLDLMVRLGPYASKLPPDKQSEAIQDGIRLILSTLKDSIVPVTFQDKLYRLLENSQRYASNFNRLGNAIEQRGVKAIADLVNIPYEFLLKSLKKTKAGLKDRVTEAKDINDEIYQKSIERLYLTTLIKGDVSKLSLTNLVKELLVQDADRGKSDLNAIVDKQRAPLFLLEKEGIGVRVFFNGRKRHTLENPTVAIVDYDAVLKSLSEVPVSDILAKETLLEGAGAKQSESFTRLWGHVSPLNLKDFLATFFDSNGVALDPKTVAENINRTTQSKTVSLFQTSAETRSQALVVLKGLSKRTAPLAIEDISQAFKGKMAVIEGKRQPRFSPDEVAQLTADIGTIVGRKKVNIDIDTIVDVFEGGQVFEKSVSEFVTQLQKRGAPIASLAINNVETSQHNAAAKAKVELRNATRQVRDTRKEINDLVDQIERSEAEPAQAARKLIEQLRNIAVAELDAQAEELFLMLDADKEITNEERESNTLAIAQILKGDIASAIKFATRQVTAGIKTKGELKFKSLARTELKGKKLSVERWGKSLYRTANEARLFDLAVEGGKILDLGGLGQQVAGFHTIQNGLPYNAFSQSNVGLVNNGDQYVDPRQYVASKNAELRSAVRAKYPPFGYFKRSEKLTDNKGQPALVYVIGNKEYRTMKSKAQRGVTSVVSKDEKGKEVITEVGSVYYPVIMDEQFGGPVSGVFTNDYVITKAQMLDLLDKEISVFLPSNVSVEINPSLSIGVDENKRTKVSKHTLTGLCGDTDLYNTDPRSAEHFGSTRAEPDEYGNKRATRGEQSRTKALKMFFLGTYRYFNNLVTKRPYREEYSKSVLQVRKIVATVIASGDERFGRLENDASGRVDELFVDVEQMYGAKFANYAIATQIYSDIKKSFDQAPVKAALEDWLRAKKLLGRDLFDPEVLDNLPPEYTKEALHNAALSSFVSKTDLKNYLNKFFRVIPDEGSAASGVSDADVGAEFERNARAAFLSLDKLSGDMLYRGLLEELFDANWKISGAAYGGAPSTTMHSAIASYTRSRATTYTKQIANENKLKVEALGMLDAEGEADPYQDLRDSWRGSERNDEKALEERKELLMRASQAFASDTVSDADRFIVELNNNPEMQQVLRNIARDQFRDGAAIAALPFTPFMDHFMSRITSNQKEAILLLQGLESNKIEGGQEIAGMLLKQDFYTTAKLDTPLRRFVSELMKVQLTGTTAKERDRLVNDIVKAYSNENLEGVDKENIGRVSKRRVVDTLRFVAKAMESVSGQVRDANIEKTKIQNDIDEVVETQRRSMRFLAAVLGMEEEAPASYKETKRLKEGATELLQKVKPARNMLAPSIKERVIATAKRELAEVGLLIESNATKSRLIEENIERVSQLQRELEVLDGYAAKVDRVKANPSDKISFPTEFEDAIDKGVSGLTNLARYLDKNTNLIRVQDIVEYTEQVRKKVSASSIRANVARNAQTQEAQRLEQLKDRLSSTLQLMEQQNPYILLDEIINSISFAEDQIAEFQKQKQGVNKKLVGVLAKAYASVKTDEHYKNFVAVVRLHPVVLAQKKAAGEALTPEQLAVLNAADREAMLMALEDRASAALNRLATSKAVREGIAEAQERQKAFKQRTVELTPEGSRLLTEMNYGSPTGETDFDGFRSTMFGHVNKVLKRGDKSLSEIDPSLRDQARVANIDAAARLGLRSGEPDSVLVALRMIQSSGTPLERAVASLLLSAPDLVRSTNIILGDYSSAVAGLYDPESKTVIINMSDSNGRGLANVLLHEYIHAVTRQIIENPTTEQQRQAVARINQLRLLADKMYRESGRNSLAIELGLESNIEFITYALTVPEFASMLRSFKPADQRSLFRRVIDSIRQMFSRLVGRQPEVEAETLNALDELFNFAKMSLGHANSFNISARREAARAIDKVDQAVADIAQRMMDTPVLDFYQSVEEGAAAQAEAATQEFVPKDAEAANNFALANIRSVLPEGYTVEAVTDLGIGVLGSRRRKPNTVLVNPISVGSIVAGKSKDNALLALRAAVDHEIAHLEANKLLSSRDYEQIANELGEDVLNQIADKYYSLVEPDRKLRAERIAIARQTGELSNLDLASEWVRMQIERMAFGTTAEDNLALLLDKPNLLQRIIDGVREYIKSLRSNFNKMPSAGTAARISMASRELRKLRNGGVLPKGDAPQVGSYGDSDAFLVALDDDQTDENMDRTSYMLPIATTPAKQSRITKVWEKILDKVYMNFGAKLKELVDIRDGTFAEVQLDMEWFSRKFPKLRDEALAKGVDIEDIGMLLGTRKPIVSDAVESAIKREVGAYLAANANRNDKAAVQREADELNLKRYREEAAKVSEQFRIRQEAMENTLRSQGFGELVDTAVEFRQRISRFKVGIGFDETNDVYLTRTYRYFTSEAYRLAVRNGLVIKDENGNDIDFKVLRLQAAKLMFEADTLKAATYPMTDEQINNSVLKQLDDYLDELDEKHAANAKYDGVKALNRDLNILKNKKDIDDRITKLLGDVADPFENGIRTIYSVARLSANNQFQKDFAERALKLGLASRVKEEGMVELFSERFDPKYGPMAGLYVREDIAKAVEELFGSRGSNESAATGLINSLGRRLSYFSGLTITAKTSLSVGFYARNIVGGTLLLTSNGIIPTSGNFVEAAKLTWNAHTKNAVGGMDQDRRNLLRRLTELQVVRDEVNGRIAYDMLRGFASGTEQEFDETFNAILKAQATGDESTAKSIMEKLQVPIDKTVSFTQQLNNVVDGFFRTYAFLHEMENLREDFPDKQNSELEVMAARKVKLTMPTHSQQMDFAKAFNKSPFAMVLVPFMRWKSEVLRIAVNIPMLALEEINSGNAGQRARGIKRLAGFTLTSSPIAGTILGGFFSILFGALRDDEEDDENRELTREEIAVLREGLPQWQRSHGIHARLVGGKVQIIDMTNILPFSQFSDIYTLISEGVTTGKGVNAKAIASYLSSEMLGTQIAFTAASEVANNRDDFGNKIYLDEDTAVQATIKMLAHFGKGTLAPAIGTKALSILRPGEQDRLEIVLGELTGARPNLYEKTEIVRRGLSRIKEGSDEAVMLRSAVSSGRAASRDEIEDSINRYQDALNRNQRRLQEFLKFSGEIGLSQKDIAVAAKTIGISQQTLADAMIGRRLTWKPNAAFLNKVEYNVKQVGEDDPAERVKQILEIVRDRPTFMPVAD